MILELRAAHLSHARCQVRGHSLSRMIINSNRDTLPRPRDLLPLSSRPLIVVAGQTMTTIRLLLYIEGLALHLLKVCRLSTDLFMTVI